MYDLVSNFHTSSGRIRDLVSRGEQVRGWAGIHKQGVHDASQAKFEGLQSRLIQAASMVFSSCSSANVLNRADSKQLRQQHTIC